MKGSEQMQRIYFDMDGTIANLYKDHWLEQLRAESPIPYAIADRLVEEEVLQALIDKGYELGIISWLAKNGSAEYNKAVRQAKRYWLKDNYPNIKFVEIHIVKYGTPKQYVCNIKGQILIDDEEPNRNAWNGIALEPKDIINLL